MALYTGYFEVSGTVRFSWQGAGLSGTYDKTVTVYLRDIYINDPTLARDMALKILLRSMPSIDTWLPGYDAANDCAPKVHASWLSSCVKVLTAAEWGSIGGTWGGDWGSGSTGGGTWGGGGSWGGSW